MFRGTIRGLDRLFKTDIKPPKVVLVTGPPGAMKSSFVYALMARYVSKTGQFGLYTTLEEATQSHVQNMNALGLKLHRNMHISDLTDLREMDQLFEENETTDYIEFIESQIGLIKEKRGPRFDVFALDSLGALYSLMENAENMRKRMYYFFKMLRDNELISFVIMERTLSGEAQLLGNEGFLVDGIIHLGLERSRGKIVRYLQVEKMRAVSHSMEKHAVDVGGESGISILGPVLSA
ncbi:MAG: signal transduction protein [Thermoplasmata archaeon]|nr:MAG: signal transduction protein [Thermoplasmata archaeon]